MNKDSETTFPAIVRYRFQRDGSLAVQSIGSANGRSQCLRIGPGAQLSVLRAGESEWQDVELMVNGVAFAAPAHVLVEISNAAGEYLQVDDVHLVHAKDVDVLRSH